jgi:ferritin-like metal-binding protein YciE
MLLDEKQVTETLHEILREFARRHHTQTFYKHCKEIKGLIEELKIIMVYPMNEKCLSVLTAPWNMIESKSFHCRRF